MSQPHNTSGVTVTTSTLVLFESLTTVFSLLKSGLALYGALIYLTPNQENDQFTVT